MYGLSCRNGASSPFLRCSLCSLAESENCTGCQLGKREARFTKTDKERRAGARTTRRTRKARQEKFLPRLLVAWDIGGLAGRLTVARRLLCRWLSSCGLLCGCLGCSGGIGSGLRGGSRLLGGLSLGCGGRLLGGSGLCRGGLWLRLGSWRGLGLSLLSRLRRRCCLGCGCNLRRRCRLGCGLRSGLGSGRSLRRGSRLLHCRLRLLCRRRLGTRRARGLGARGLLRGHRLGRRVLRGLGRGVTEYD